MVPKNEQTQKETPPLEGMCVNRAAALGHASITGPHLNVALAIANTGPDFCAVVQHSTTSQSTGLHAT